MAAARPSGSVSLKKVDRERIAKGLELKAKSAGGWSNVWTNKDNRSRGDLESRTRSSGSTNSRSLVPTIRTVTAPAPFYVDSGTTVRCLDVAVPRTAELALVDTDRSRGTGSDPSETLPAWVYTPNLMVATWSIGRNCIPAELAKRLADTPFDLIVLIMSSKVVEGDEIYEFLQDLAYAETLREEVDVEEYREALRHVAVVGFGASGNVECEMFVAMHKFKVMSAEFTKYHIRSRGINSAMQLVKLTLTLNEARQRMDSITVGIVNVQGALVTWEDRLGIAQLVIGEKLDMLTGFFKGSNGVGWVTKLAVSTGAIWWVPMYEGISALGNAFIHPTWYLFFGFYSSVKVPAMLTEFAEDIDLGQDIWDDMIDARLVPAWPRNDSGNAFVKRVGTIKMKEPDWNRWFDVCFQTCIWLGASIQSRSSRARHAMHKENRAQSKGKWKKGKGKGKGKSSASSTALAVAEVGEWL